ncbi:MAG: VTT domain-containing protein [Opitutales bacterium]
MKEFFRWRRNYLLLALSALFTALCLYLLWQSYPHPDDWRRIFNSSLEYLRTHPWALLAALATLPGIGFPISPLLVLIGIALAPRYGLAMTCTLGILAQSCCTTWTYLLASGPLRSVLRRFLSQRRELPHFDERNALRLGLILRITPGIPYALQNIVLGIVGMRFRPYLMVSIPITALWTIGFIVTGGAFFEGRAGLAISGILLLIVLVLLTKMLQRKTQVNHG